VNGHDTSDEERLERVVDWIVGLMGHRLDPTVFRAAIRLAYTVGRRDERLRDLEQLAAREQELAERT